MAITRMDEGFEIPDVRCPAHSLTHSLTQLINTPRTHLCLQDLKQYDVTDQFDGSVGKAKNAVECGQIACDKHGVFVLSKRLTKSSGRGGRC